MNGVAEIARREPSLGLRVAEANAIPNDGGGVFAHGPIGRNRDPRLKTDEFSRRLGEAGASPVDIAFHKYCYADIEGGTNVEALFDHYQQTMKSLRAAHPDIVFVHVTTPLQCARPTWKSVVKQMLGRASARFADNAARERFNDFMRSTYRGVEPVFDLAVVESTHPDGARETMRSAGRTTYALVPEYASDGSHLNEPASQRVAEELLMFLARGPAPEK